MYMCPDTYTYICVLKISQNRFTAIAWVYSWVTNSPQFGNNNITFQLSLHRIDIHHILKNKVPFQLSPYTVRVSFPHILYSAYIQINKIVMHYLPNNNVWKLGENCAKNWKLCEKLKIGWKLIFVENFMFMRLSRVLCWGGRRIRGRGRCHGGVGGGRREGSRKGYERAVGVCG